jgi:Ice-binding-like/PEP-CTERM motif
MRPRRIRCFALSFLLLPLLVHSAYADSINLGTAGSYGVLAGSTVTNTGSSVINGNLGVGPGCAITGFPPGKVNGATNACNAATIQAQSDLTKAFIQGMSLTRTGTLTGQDLGGKSLTHGVYFFATSAQLTGVLTLTGKPGAAFVFQIGSTLTTASSSSVIFINSLTGKPMNDPHIYWVVGSSATLGTSTKFAGHILALTSITLNNGASITCGSALARNGAVTMNNNVITTGCGGQTTPEPGTIGLMGSGLVIMAGVVRRKLRI